MDIPATVSGRPVTNRGTHIVPFGHHTYWIQKADYWISLLQSMHMSWVVALSESDALRISGAAEALLDGGIIPIVRFAYKLPDSWTHVHEVEKLVALYSRYNAPCIIQFSNEPFDAREWKKKVPPPDKAWPIIRDKWNDAAHQIVSAGAIAGFPDGPCYDTNPFSVIGDPDGYWADGRAVYLTHNYGKGRPLNYPRDDVSRFGTPLTMDEYREAMDDYADDKNWMEGEFVLGMMNAQRAAWANPSITAIDDDTCFMGWLKTQFYAVQAFGFQVQMALTEGGWVPRDRAGSNPTDIRWPFTTPKMVAKNTLAMYQADTPLFAICPWLLACGEMGGSGWEFDAWVGWAYSEKYGMEKPVVQMLRDNPPETVPMFHCDGWDRTAHETSEPVTNVLELGCPYCGGNECGDFPEMTHLCPSCLKDRMNDRCNPRFEIGG